MWARCTPSSHPCHGLLPCVQHPGVLEAYRALLHAQRLVAQRSSDLDAQREQRAQQHAAGRSEEQPAVDEARARVARLTQAERDAERSLEAAQAAVAEAQAAADAAAGAVTAAQADVRTAAAQVQQRQEVERRRLAEERRLAEQQRRQEEEERQRHEEERRQQEAEERQRLVEQQRRQEEQRQRQQQQPGGSRQSAQKRPPPAGTAGRPSLPKRRQTSHAADAEGLAAVGAGIQQKRWQLDELEPRMAVAPARAAANPAAAAAAAAQCQQRGGGGAAAPPADVIDLTLDSDDD